MFFISAMEQIFSFGERWNAFHVSPHENICTISLINIHYLYNEFVKKFWVINQWVALSPVSTFII